MKGGKIFPVFELFSQVRYIICLEKRMIHPAVQE